MRGIITLFSFLIFPAFLSGQINLVPNPSFEDTVRCPTDSTITKTKCWYPPTMGTPDYFYLTMWGNAGCNSLSFPDNRWGGGGFNNAWGYQLPHSGIGYVGFGVPNGTEHFAIKLLDTLKFGKKYAVSAYVSLANNSGSGIDLIQFAFEDHKVAVYDTITFGSTYINDSIFPDVGNQSGNIIIDTANWVFITDTFVAEGGEEYMIVGNFDNIGQTQYQTVDSSIQWNYAYYYFDDFDVHCLDCSTSIPPSPDIPIITLYPNPSSGNFQLTGNFPSGTKLKIYDMLGQELSEEEITSGNQTVALSFDLAEGIYIYRIECGSEVLTNGKLEIVK